MRRGKLEKTGSAMEFELGISKAAFPRSAPEFWFSGAVRDADRLVGLDADMGADAGLAPVDVEPGVFASPLATTGGTSVELNGNKVACSSNWR